MDSKPSAHPATYSFTQARDALRSCQETLLSSKTDFDHVFSVLHPFEDCTGFTDATPEHSAALAAMLSATLADCYRERQEFERAAKLYRRAGGNPPITGFEELYAEMVLKQRMQEHYDSALQFLMAAQEDSRGQPLLQRIRFQAAAFWRDTCSLRFRNPFKSWYLIRRLKRLVARNELHPGNARGE